jgi:hypothetical protein
LSLSILCVLSRLGLLAAMLWCNLGLAGALDEPELSL